MSRRLAVDVAYHDAALVLVQQLGGNLTGNDFAKQTTLFCHFLAPFPS
jgi:hypothetical protein